MRIDVLSNVVEAIEKVNYGVRAGFGGLYILVVALFIMCVVVIKNR